MMTADRATGTGLHGSKAAFSSCVAMRAESRLQGYRESRLHRLRQSQQRFSGQR